MKSKHITTFCCQECGVATGSTKSLLWHLRDVHRKHFTIYYCRFCTNYASRYESERKRHEKRRHGQQSTGQTLSLSSSAAENVSILSPSQKSPSPKSRLSVASASDVGLADSSAKEEQLEHRQVVLGSKIGVQFLAKRVAESNEFEFYCSLCSFSHSLSHVVVKHIRTAHQDSVALSDADERLTDGTSKPLYKCEECTYSTGMSHNFYRHSASHHFDGPFRCIYCSYSSAREGVIAGHLRCHLNEKAVESETSSLVDHGMPKSPSKCSTPKTSPKKGSAGITGYFTCPHCSRKFVARSELSRHLRRTHGQTLTELKEAGVELFTQHPQPSKSKVRILSCTFCSYTTTRRDHLNKHVEARHTKADQPAEHSVCTSKSEVADVKSDKSLDSSKQELFNCLFCRYKTKGRARILKHCEKYHSTIGGSKFSSECSTPLSESSCSLTADDSKDGAMDKSADLLNSDAHMPEDKDKSPHVAEEDNHTMSTIADCVEGKLDATGKKTISCPDCSKCFTSRQTFRVHRQSHIDIRQYKCSYCGFRGNTRMNTYKHVRTVHKHVKNAKVIVLSETEARQTVDAYRQKYALPCGRCKVKPDTSLAIRRKFLQKPGTVARKTTVQDEKEAVKDNGASEAPQDDKVANVVHRRNTKTKRWKLKGKISNNLFQLQCPLCGFRTDWHSSAYKHKKIMHPNENCKMILLSPKEARATLGSYLKSNVAANQSFHISRMSFNPQLNKLKRIMVTCQYCSFKSNYKSNLKKHMKSRHPFENKRPVKRKRSTSGAAASAAGQLHCNECSFTTITADKLETHTEHVHTRKNTSELSICSPVKERSPAKNVTSAASRSAKGCSPPTLNGKIDKLGLRRFYCTVCSTRSNYRCVIQRHLLKHHRNLVGRVGVLSADEAMQMDASKAGNENYSCQTPTCDVSDTCLLLNETDNETDSQKIDRLLNSQTDVDSFTTTDDEIKSSLMDMSVRSTDSVMAGHTTPVRSGMRTPTRSHENIKTASPLQLQDSQRTRTPVRSQNMSAKSAATVTPLRAKRADDTVSLIKSWDTGTASDQHSSSGLEFDDLDSQGINGETTAMSHLTLPVSFPTNSVALKSPSRASHNIFTCGESPSKSQPSQTAVAVSPSPSKWLNLYNSKATYACNVCPYRAIQSKSLIAHRRLHVERPGCTLRCEFCPYFPSQPVHLERHLRLHYNTSVSCQNSDTDAGARGNVKPMLKCERCPFMTTRRPVLIYHRQSHRPRPAAKFKCEHCAFWVTELRLLKLHGKVHSANYTVQRLQPHQTAPETNNAFRTSASDMDISGDVIEMAWQKQQLIISHSLLHGTQENSEDVNSAQSMGCHSASENSIAKDSCASYDDASLQSVRSSACPDAKSSLPLWCCDRCPYSTNDLLPFKRHLSLHGKHRRCECTYCDYSVSFVWQLVPHLRLHFAVNKNVLHSQSLVNLCNTHPLPQSLAGVPMYAPEPEVPSDVQDMDKFSEHKCAVFRCNRCPFTCEQRQQLVAHMRCHVVKSCHCCPLCDFSSGHHKQLESHILLHFDLPGSPLSIYAPSARHDPFWKKFAEDLSASLLTKYVDPSSAGRPIESSSENSTVNEATLTDPRDKDGDISDKAEHPSPPSSNQLLSDPGLEADDAKQSTEETAEDTKTDCDRDEAECKSVQLGHTDAIVDQVLEPLQSDEHSDEVIPFINDNMLKVEENCIDFICKYCDRPCNSASYLAKHEDGHIIGSYLSVVRVH